MTEDKIRAVNAAALGKHPAIGGALWNADLEMGAKTRDILGQYVPLVASCSPEEQLPLLVELAGKLYDNLASVLIGRIKPGNVQDAIQFESLHMQIADVAVWQVLKEKGIRLDDDECQAIELALTGFGSRWQAAALRKVNSDRPTAEASDSTVPDGFVSAEVRELRTAQVETMADTGPDTTAPPLKTTSAEAEARRQSSQSFRGHSDDQPGKESGADSKAGRRDDPMSSQSRGAVTQIQKGDQEIANGGIADPPQKKRSKASIEASLASKSPLLARMPPGLQEQALEHYANEAYPDGSEKERDEFKRYWRARVDREQERLDPISAEAKDFSARKPTAATGADGSSYELTSDFRDTKAALDRSLRDVRGREAEEIQRFPEGHSQRNCRIEDACCGHLKRAAEQYWNYLLEPAPLSGRRRSELFQYYIHEAFQDVGREARECGGYEAVADFRDKILADDEIRKRCAEAEFSTKSTNSSSNEECDSGPAERSWILIAMGHLSPESLVDLDKGLSQEVYLDAYADFNSASDDAFTAQFPPGRACSEGVGRAGIIRLSKRLDELAREYFENFANRIKEKFEEQIAGGGDPILTGKWREAAVPVFAKKLWRDVEAVWSGWLTEVRTRTGGTAYGARVRTLDDPEHLTLILHQQRMTQCLSQIEERFAIPASTIRDIGNFAQRQPVVVRQPDRTGTDETTGKPEVAEQAHSHAGHSRQDEPTPSASGQATTPLASEPGPEAERAAARKAIVMPILQSKRWKRGKWATAAGVGKNCVYEYLTGKRRLSVENREAMAEALGLSPEELPE